MFGSTGAVEPTITIARGHGYWYHSALDKAHFPDWQRLHNFRSSGRGGEILPPTLSSMKIKSIAGLFCALVLSGCTAQSVAQGESRTPSEQGPTGVIAEPGVNVRESYLIPPEIPPSLLTHIFRRQALSEKKGEILSISVLDSGEERWTLEIIREFLPDEIRTDVHRFTIKGKRWREL
jgi:hypothetical protein